MIKVLLATSDDSLETRLREAIGDSFLRVAPQSLPADAGAFLTGLSVPRPDIAVLDTGGDDQAALALAESLLHTHRVSVILVSPEPTVLGLDAMRAGVRDLLPTDVEPDGLRAALDRAALFV